MAYRKHTLAWLPIMIALSFAVYGAGIGIQHYGDDFQFVFENPAGKILYFFSHRNPENVFYRPIQSSFSALMQTLFNLQTWPIHVIQITLHGCLVWLLSVVMRRLGFSVLQRMIGSGFALVAQSNVIVVLSPDSFSQISGVLCGSLSLWLVHLSCNTSRDNRLKNVMGNRLYWYALFMLACSLLSKESRVKSVNIVIEHFANNIRQQPAVAAVLESGEVL